MIKVEFERLWVEGISKQKKFKLAFSFVNIV